MTIFRSKDDVSKREPYSDGTCWYGLKTKLKHATQPCMLDARLYRVERAVKDAGFGFRTIEQAQPSMEVWLCDNHKNSLERDGFLLHLVNL